MDLTLRQIRYFVYIVEAGSLARAAKRLRIAPTALSMQVRAMEERLGARLLDHHPKGVSPTESGIEFLTRGQQILKMVDEAERAIRSGGSASAKRLRVGVPPSVVRTVGVDAVLAATSHFGGHVLQLVESRSIDMVQQLHDQEIDFALAFDLRPSESLGSFEVYEEELVFVTKMAEEVYGPEVDLATVLSSELVFFGEAGNSWRAIHAAARSASLTVNVTEVVPSIELIRHLVMRGLFTAILPFGMVAEDYERGRLEVHAITDPAITRRMSLGWLAAGPIHRPELDQMSSYVQNLTSIIQERCIVQSRRLFRAIHGSGPGDPQEA